MEWGDNIWIICMSCKYYRKVLFVQSGAKQQFCNKMHLIGY